MAEMKPTIVLCHGAFADGSSWNGVIAILLEQGYTAISIANPLRSVQNDGDYLTSVLKTIDGPVVLVGHSYGGMVISNAASDKVKAYVFVAAFAPDTGDSAASLSEMFAGSTLGETLVAVPLSDGNVDLYVDRTRFWGQFAADVPREQAKLMGAEQRPVTQAALEGGSSAAPWKTIPSWFVFGDSDKNIPAAVHRYMAERADAVETVEVAGASHVVMISNPAAVAEMIVAAAEAVPSPI